MSEHNGTPEVKPSDKPIQDQLAEARARRELLQEQFRTHILERHLHENNILRESSYFGNRAIDPRDLLVGGDDWRPINMPIDTTTARKGGRDWPVIATEIDLDYYREQSRRLCQTNSFARGLLINLTNYIVGSGPKIKFVAREELDDAKTKAAKAAAKVGQKYLDAWAKKVKLKWRVRDIFKRMKRDGESFTRLYPDEDHGYLELRTVEPVYIRNKPGGTEQDGWALGVQNLVHEDGSHDVETSVAYHVVFPWTLKHYADGTADKLKRPLEDRERFTGTGEVVPADEIVHVKNVDEDSTVKRGLPEFIFDTADACRRAASLLRNSSEGSAMRAAIAMVSQWDSATQADISTFLGAQADDLQRNPLTGNLERIQMVSGPQHLHVPKGHEFVSNPTAQGTATDPQIAQADLRMVVAAFCAPEYWTGDATGSNYSSTKEAASPIMRDAEVEQEYIADVVQEICQRALKCGVDHNRIPAEILELCEVQVEMPKLQVRDRSETITEEMQLFQSGLQSRATTQMNCGLTPHREDANIKQEQLEQAKQNPMAAMGQPGQQPPPGTSAGSPPADPDGGPQIPPPPAPPPKPAAPPIPDVPPPPQFMRESATYSTHLPPVPVREEKDASGHEHKGKGPGGGQFVSKGEGKGSVSTSQKQKEDKAKFVGKTVGWKEKERANDIEKEIASALGHDWETDNKFYDCKSKDDKHFVEVKSKLKGSKKEITVHDDALLRKVDGMAENPGATYHTIVVDERDSWEGGKHAEHHSGHRMYYKRGNGRYRPDQMHPVKNAAELRRLIAMPDDKLPDQAKGSLPTNPKEVAKLRESAEKASKSRKAKDAARREKLKSAGRNVYERQT